MSQQLGLRGNSQPTIGTFVGAQKEALIDTTNQRIIVSDGITPGGWAAAKMAEVSRLSVLIRGLNLNLVGDVQVPITLPQGITLYRITEIVMSRASAVPALSTGFLGVFTGPGGTGFRIAPNQSYGGAGISTIAPNTQGNSLSLAINSTPTLNLSTIFINVGVANGAPLTVDMQIVIAPFS